MPIDTLGKLFFPRQQRWQRRRTINTILLTLALAIITSGIFAAFAVWGGSKLH